MRRIALGALVLMLSFAGCTGRHVVVERDAGRVDSERSITSMSDTAWTIESEPSEAEDAAR